MPFATAGLQLRALFLDVHHHESAPQAAEVVSSGRFPVYSLSAGGGHGARNAFAANRRRAAASFPAPSFDAVLVSVYVRRRKGVAERTR